MARQENVTFKYKDRDNNITERDLLLKKIYKGQNRRMYLEAFSVLRDEERTFRLTGVVNREILDKETGEVTNIRSLWEYTE